MKDITHIEELLKDYKDTKENTDLIHMLHKLENIHIAFRDVVLHVINDIGNKHI